MSKPDAGKDKSKGEKGDGKDGKATGKGKGDKDAANVEAPQMSEADRQAAVLFSTFANVELQSTKTTLAQYVQLYGDSCEENAKLRQELLDREKDSVGVVQFLRAELDRRQDNLKEQARKSGEEIEKLRGVWNEERMGLHGKMNEKVNEIKELQNVVEQKDADLAALEAFRRERHELHMEHSRLQEQLKEERIRYEEEISSLRFRSLEEKVRLKAEERTMSDNFEKEVNTKAMNLLDPKTREIHSENFMLLQDKILMEKELAKLSKTNVDLAEKFGEQKRDAELTGASEKECMKRNVKLVRENRQLNDKCKQLETTLQQVVEQYETQISNSDKGSSQQIQVLKRDRDDAYKNAEARYKELQKMRTLTKQIVQQRSDLEIFFNEALEYVRGEISREKADILMLKHRQGVPQLTMGGTGGSSTELPSRKQLQLSRPHQEHAFFQGTFEPLSTQELSGGVKEPVQQRPPSSAGGDGVNPPAPQSQPGPIKETPPQSAPTQRTSTSASSLPPLAVQGAPGSRKQGAAGQQQSGGKPGSQQQPVAGSGAIPRVDISQLNWTDKERVLRILFAKINSSTNNLKGSAGGSNLVPAPTAPRASLPPSRGVPSIEGNKQVLKADDSTFVTQQ